jgi:hypothetical protein
MATRASLWLMMVVDVQLVFVQNVYLTKLSYLLSNRSFVLNRDYFNFGCRISCIELKTKQ